MFSTLSGRGITPLIIFLSDETCLPYHLLLLKYGWNVSFPSLTQCGCVCRCFAVCFYGPFSMCCLLTIERFKTVFIDRTLTPTLAAPVLCATPFPSRSCLCLCPCLAAVLHLPPPVSLNPCLLACLSACPPSYMPACLPSCPPACLPACLPSCLSLPGYSSTQ